MNTDRMVREALDDSRVACNERRIKDLDQPQGNSQDYVDAAAGPSESGSPVMWLVILPVLAVGLLVAMWILQGG